MSVDTARLCGSRSGDRLGSNFLDVDVESNLVCDAGALSRVEESAHAVLSDLLGAPHRLLKTCLRVALVALHAAPRPSRGVECFGSTSSAPRKTTGRRSCRVL